MMHVHRPIVDSDTEAARGLHESDASDQDVHAALGQGSPRKARGLFGRQGSCRHRGQRRLRLGLMRVDDGATRAASIGSNVSPSGGGESQASRDAYAGRV